jgi:hypothetical protein
VSRRRKRRRSVAEPKLEAVGSTALILIEAPSSAYPSGMLSLENNHSNEEETFYVAVLVKPFLSSSSSDMVLCPLKHLRLYHCDLR